MYIIILQGGQTGFITVLCNNKYGKFCRAIERKRF